MVTVTATAYLIVIPITAFSVSPRLQPQVEDHKLIWGAVRLQFRIENSKLVSRTWAGGETVGFLGSIGG
ncbi:hypothetical protein [Sphingopyxis sp.]|uniref:hypothetical protein n=1 Tax=Sphingopyxis sp. TaxID=1908224 RepID=UPI0025CF102E|nr:hypothetical protein [Sphingopyxis sp.]MBK6413850.1 hypothetical protein [Sphingopyxis sp.]